MKPDLPVGERFGRVVIVSIRSGSDGYRIAHCRCDCGVMFDTKLYILRRGSCRSCGCLQKEMARILVRKHAMPQVITHGATRGHIHSPEYVVWAGMIQRCQNPRHVSYHRYGGRGIEVCAEWKFFESFISDMGPRPSAKHTIERCENDGPYSKANCKWATRAEQSRNTPRSRRLTFNNKTMVLQDWATEVNLSAATLIRRLASGWSVDKTLSTPNLNRVRK